MEKNNDIYGKYRVLVIDNKNVISECLGKSGYGVMHITEPYSDLVRSIEDCDIVVCNLPFESEKPFIVDKLCDEHSKSIIFPLCFGWGVVLTLLRPGGDRIDKLANDYKIFYHTVVQRVLDYGQYVKTPYHWLEDYLCNNDIKQPEATEYLAAAMCANLLSRISEEREINYFPKFYIASLDSDQFPSQVYR